MIKPVVMPLDGERKVLEVFVTPRKYYAYTCFLEWKDEI